MNFFTAVASAWLGFLSLFGAMHMPFLSAPAQMPAGVQGDASSSMPMGPHPDARGVQNMQSAGQGQQNGTPSLATQMSPSTAAAVSNVTLPATGSAWASVLPLGDGKYSTTGAKKGYVYVCHIAQGGGGAQGKATWINGSSWYPNEKVSVQGSVPWPNASYSMLVSGSTRTIKTNDLPTDHTSGTFPISKTDPAYTFDGNPNSIAAQTFSFALPAMPTMSATPNCIFGQVGVMNDGVVLFDGFDAEYRDAVAHETQDAYEAHPDSASVYHYHGFESGYVKDPVSTVVGYAFDGYPITGSLMPDGTYLKTNDLDECHGVTSSITLDGKTVTSYHYVLTQDFPYSVSCFRGTSYEPKPGGGSGKSGQGSQQGTQAQMGQMGGQVQQGQQSGMQPPQAAITACANASSGGSCSFSTPNGIITGTCQTPPSQSSLACVPSH